jgi:hypothetical protein
VVRWDGGWVERFGSALSEFSNRFDRIDSMLRPLVRVRLYFLGVNCVATRKIYVCANRVLPRLTNLCRFFVSAPRRLRFLLDDESVTSGLPTPFLWWYGWRTQ